MACRIGNREQYSLLPPCIDDSVGPDDPVRAYDAFVDALDLDALGIQVQRKNSDVENFSYNESTDTYHCPEGHILFHYTVDNEKKRYRYKISDVLYFVRNVVGSARVRHQNTAER